MTIFKPQEALLFFFKMVFLFNNVNQSLDYAFPVKDNIVNSIGFVGHTVSVATVFDSVEQTMYKQMSLTVFQ